MENPSVRELLLYPNILKDNILEVWEQCDSEDYNQGMSWYPLAHSFCNDLATASGLNLIQTSSIVSVLSVQKSWEENQKIAKEFINKNRKSHTKQQIDKAKAIKKTIDYDEILNIIGGPKTKAFFKCLYNPEDKESIVIDRHMIYICLQKNITDVTLYQYNKIANIYVEMAKELNIRPLIFQSILWIHHRKYKNIKNYVTGPF